MRRKRSPVSKQRREEDRSRGKGPPPPRPRGKSHGSRLDAPAPRHTARTTSPAPHPSLGKRLAEWSRNDDSGGGVETQAWDIWVNDGWMTPSELRKRGPLDGAAATRDDGRGSHVPPGHQYYWATYVETSIGRRFRRRTSRPDRERARASVWSQGVPRIYEETLFRLVADQRLQEENAAAADEREEHAREGDRREEPLPPEEIARRAAEFLASLEAPPAPSSPRAIDAAEPEHRLRRSA